MRRLIRPVLLSTAFLILLSPSARAQQDTAAVGSTFTPAHLRDLPSSDNVYSLLETSEGEVISDRFYGGGLNTGRSALDGAFLNSWSQTQFFVGDVNITMPNGGVPFLFPTATPWDRVDVAGAMMPITANAQGLAVSFQPMRPGASWTRFIEGSGAGGGLVAKSSASVAPPIETLRQWSHGGFFVSGPVSPRVGLMLDAEWSGASQIERNGGSQADGQLASVLTHLVFKRTDRDEIRALGWIQRTQSPLLQATLVGTPIADQTTFGHVQATWARQTAVGGEARIFGAYSQGSGSRDRALPAAFTMERLLVGPIPNIVDSGDLMERQWTAGVRWHTMPRDNDHMLAAGADVTGANTSAAPGYAGAITEAIDGKPARIWQYQTSGAESHRHATFLNAYVSDQIGYGPGRSLDLGVSYDGVIGSADGAANGITWHNVLPRLMFRWRQGPSSHFTWIAGYRRAVDRLTLDTLAVGDPAAPTAVVGLVVVPPVPTPVPSRLPPPTRMRVGPGTGGNPAFSAIDGSLNRPISDEIVAGIDAQLSPNIRGRITAVGRTMRNLFDLSNVGAPQSSYTQFTVLDGRPPEDGGDVQLPVYNRIPTTFGADRYLLANRADDKARGAALVLNSEANLRQVTLMFNASASITDGPAMSRGFRVDENNLGALGEASSNPNAAIDARGRLFYDRAFTIKLSAVYRFPYAITLGMIARYQDGQPFSRVTLVPGFTDPGRTDPRQPNQGQEIIRAYEAGDARFMYTGTLDLRLKKAFRFATRSVDLFVDAYNLPNMGNEVEERVVTGPGFRDITAVQPPASVHIGARVTF